MVLSPWYRLALSIVLLGVMLMGWLPRLDKLYYHSMGKRELIDMGDATAFSEKSSSVKPNSFVEISGILGPQAATLRGLRVGSFRYGRYQIRHLLGSKIYIEYPEEKYHPLFNPYTRVTVKGRLSSFGPDSELGKVRDFFASHYHKPIDPQAMLVVVDEEPRTEFIYVVLFVFSMAILLVSFYFSIRGLIQRKKAEQREQD